MIASNKLIERKCPVCKDANNFRIYYPAKDLNLNKFTSDFSPRNFPQHSFFQYLQCLNCDLLYASPALKENKISELYKYSGLDTVKESKYAAKSYLQTFKKIIQKKNKKSLIIDIGSSDGAFLQTLHANNFSNLVGIEPSDICQNQATPFEQKASFRAEDYEKNSVDLISIFQTIEHLYDPSKTIQDACKILKDKGHIILVMHNYRSFQSRMLGKYSPLLDTQHLQIFSPKSIKYLLEKNGLKNIQVFNYPNTYPLYYWLKLLPPSFNAKKSFIKTLQKTDIGNKCIRIYGGNIGMVASKTDDE